MWLSWGAPVSFKSFSILFACLAKQGDRFFHLISLQISRFASRRKDIGVILLLFALFRFQGFV